MAEERRHGMDDVARAIGELEGSLKAIAGRLEALQVERQVQHTEAIRSLTDVQAQIHEIKHTQNNDAVKFARVEQQLETVKIAQQRDHDAMMRQLATHQEIAKEAAAVLEQQIVANRDAAVARENTIINRLDDLFSWRNKVYGAIAIVVLLLTIFGHQIVDFGRSILGNGK